MSNSRAFDHWSKGELIFLVNIREGEIKDLKAEIRELKAEICELKRQNETPADYHPIFPDNPSCEDAPVPVCSISTDPPSDDDLLIGKGK